MKHLIQALLLCAPLLFMGPARAAPQGGESGKAKVCGNGVACRCNATVRGTATLERDLDGCGRVGLRMGPGAVLDCNGHAIRGSGPKTSDYGIRIDRVSDATVRNCKVSGFKRGIRIRGGERARLEGNTVEGNTIGIEVAGNTDSGEAIDHHLERNVVTRNEQDGIHVGSGSVRTQVLENQIVRNGQEGLYVLWCTDCVVARNTIESAGTSAIYHKHTSRAQYLDNTIRGSIVHVRGESAENLFARNVLEGSAYTFEGYTNEGYAHDPGWVRVPHDNEIVGGSISGSKFCFRFHGAHDNRARGVLAIGCKPFSAKAYAGREPTGNVLELTEVNEDFDADQVANVSDPCTDADGDGFGDPGFPANSCTRDSCPSEWNPDQADADGDGFGDACDACPLTSDPAQRDADADGVGDACDPCLDADRDGFGVAGGSCGVDNCPRVANTDQADADLDGVGDACDRCPSFPDPDQDGVATCGIVVPAGLTEEQEQRFRDATVAFTRIETPASGLGPVFNGESCAECHSHPTAGGSSARVVTLIARSGEGRYDPLEERGGPLIQARGIRLPGCSVPNEPVPVDSVQSRRETPPLYGLGLIAAVPDEAILAHADPGDADGDGISGRPNRIGDRLGRFGWKAEQPAIEDFVAKSLLEEIGITSPVRPAEVRREGKETPCDRVADPEDDGRHLDALAHFVRLLPLPAAERGALEAHGETLFREVGCASCHVERLETGPSDLAPLDRQTVRAYSDFLLHDLGPNLADGVVAGEADGSEFRTAPLWGARDSAPYLHDGRAPTLEEAIALHEGEAARARERFRALEAQDREALVAFVESL